jgi:hypothetical protein
VSLNPIPAAGPPGWVVAAFQYAVGRPDRSSTISAQIRSANLAGYTRAAGYTTEQQIAIGQGLRGADAFRLGQGGGQGGGPSGPPQAVIDARARANVPAVIPLPPSSPPIVYRPPPAPPSDPPYWEGPPNPPRGPGAPGAGTPPINPNAAPAFPSMWPYVIGQVVGPSVLDAILRANQYAMGVFDTATRGPRAIPKGPTNARGRPPSTGGNPFPPQGPPITVIVNYPAQPPQASPQQPAQPPKRDDPMAGLGDIYVSRVRLPVPSAPPGKVPLWLTLLPIVGPAIFGSLMPGQGNRTVVRLTDPLTRPQPDSPGQPGLGDPFPLTGFQPSVQSFGAFGGSGAVGTNTCECKAPRKKGRKKKRTVCYSGTFIERRDGTRKTKKRKVQCL